MKKEMKIINTYIDNVCKGIRDRKTKTELKDELLSHLMEIYERNIALGLSDEDAQKDAVAHMGDSEVVSKTFKQIYPVSSAEFFKNAGWTLAYPLLLYFSYGLRAVDTLYLITFCLFFSLYKIKKVNKIFNAAFITTIVNGIVQIVFFVLQNYILFEKGFALFIVLSYQIMIVVIYTLIILGLIQIKKKLNEPKADFWLAYASIPALIISNTLAVVSKFLGVSDWFFPYLLLGFIINFLPAAVIYTTVRDIDNLGLRIPQKMHTKKKAIITFLILFIITLVLCIYSVFVPYPPVEYSTDDINTDVTEIKNNLIELGLPENIIKDLPESEILKYKDATNLEIYEEEKRTNPFIDEETTLEEDLTESHYVSYLFTLPATETEPFKVRILVAIDRFEEFDETIYTELFIDYLRNDSKDIFCKMLCEVDNVRKEIIPIHSDTVSYNDIEDLYYIFTPTKNAKNHRAYISQTITPTVDDERIWLRHEYEQNTLFKINEPFKTFWLLGSDSFYASMDNPIYVETEDTESETLFSDEVHPLLDGSINFTPSKEINDFGELAEYYSQIFN